MKIVLWNKQEGKRAVLNLTTLSVEQSLCIVQELPQDHYKVDYQDKSWIHTYHVLMLSKENMKEINNQSKKTVVHRCTGSEAIKRERLTITKSKTRYQIIFIKRRQSTANNRDCLFIGIQCATNCMEAFSMKWMPA